MKSKKILFALIVICAFCLSAIPQSKPEQWEYKVVSQCDEKKMNNQATEGWQLDQFGYASFGSLAAMVCVFKRPRP